MPFSALDVMQCIHEMNQLEHVMSVTKSVAIKFNVRLYYLPQDQWTSAGSLAQRSAESPSTQSTYSWRCAARCLRCVAPLRISTMLSRCTLGRRRWLSMLWPSWIVFSPTLLLILPPPPPPPCWMVMLAAVTQDRRTEGSIAGIRAVILDRHLQLVIVYSIASTALTFHQHQRWSLSTRKNNSSVRRRAASQRHVH